MDVVDVIKGLTVVALRNWFVIHLDLIWLYMVSCVDLRKSHAFIIEGPLTVCQCVHSPQTNKSRANEIAYMRKQTFSYSNIVKEKDRSEKTGHSKKVSLSSSDARLCCVQWALYYLHTDTPRSL